MTKRYRNESTGRYEYQIEDEAYDSLFRIFKSGTYILVYCYKKDESLSNVLGRTCHEIEGDLYTTFHVDDGYTVEDVVDLFNNNYS